MEADMLSSHDTRRVADALVKRYGAVTIAAAVLRAREAEERGELIAMVDWQRIAREALRRLPAELLNS
jgi:hypothetical protein